MRGRYWPERLECRRSSQTLAQALAAVAAVEGAAAAAAAVAVMVGSAAEAGVEAVAARVAVEEEAMARWAAAARMRCCNADQIGMRGGR